MKRLLEGFNYRRFTPGQVKFSHSSWSDPHIQHIVAAIAKAANITVQDVEAVVNEDINKLNDLANKAPVLYHTVKTNAVENCLWKYFSKADVPSNAPKFSTTVFFDLLRFIRAEHDEFFPLRGFIDRRRLQNPQYIFVGDGSKESEKWKSVDTAAATPSGVFAFNLHFMQKLMDYSHLKGVKPKGKKYVSNGGRIPDEYGYIEFLIMHEFMHYSNDDFYYQKIIPNANMKIINWVGDFRTNYLLVKSGYEQLPMGLFNDLINYDRQKEYIEMYKIVKEEFEKLPKDQQKSVSDAMDGMSDDHQPGNEEGEEKSEEEIPSGTSPSDIDEKGKETERQMEGGEDLGNREREGKEQEQEKKQQEEAQRGKPGKGGGGQFEVDYSKIKPTFNWRTLIQRFVKSAKVQYEYTYSRPARRGVSGLETLRQTGAGAIQPAERPLEHIDLNLMFVLDCSGSMQGDVAKVYSNAQQLLRMPIFAKSNVFIMKFSDTHELYRGNFAQNKAVKMKSMADKNKTFNMTMQQVFATTISGGTTLTAEAAADIAAAAKHGFNVMVVSDTDILYGENKERMLALIKEFPRQIFVIMANRECYISWRRDTGIATPNISHFD